MRYAGLKFIVILALAAGCADSRLVDGMAEAEMVGPESARSTQLALSPTETLQAERGMTLFMGEGRFAEASDTGTIRCEDADGNRVPGLFLFAQATITGRFFYMDEMAGVFVRDRCILSTAETLTIEGTWTFRDTATSEAIWGTYTASVALADGAFTHHEVIAAGTGRFAQATGWIRGIGTIPLGGGDSMFYGKGLITRPQAVSAQGFALDAAMVSGEGELVCLEGDGPPPGLGVAAQFSFTGLATSLGAVNGLLVNERCSTDFQGFLTITGTWTLAGAQGDSLSGTHTLRLSQRPGIRTELLVTRGTGPFEGVSGSATGIGRLNPEGLDLSVEGLLYLPR